MLLTFLACASVSTPEPPGTLDSAPVYEGGWSEVACEERTDPARWAIDVEEPAPVYFLILRELNDGPTWIGGMSPVWDEATGEYQQLDPSGVNLDCRAWLSR